MKYRKRRVILMRGRLFKIRNAVKRLYQQGYVVQRQKSDYLKRKREAIRRHLLNEFSNGYIDWLISYPLRRLQGMRFKDGSSRKPRFISEHIDENSSTPLIRQVLLRNASSSPSSCSRNRSSSH
ncbi:uncharacterized protein LOC129573366 [Sitodiplosis mosellana]|uniref:uncharacterized protein LOC129573366 n=1 Tax=Sitodiplosis mosellana TaxID=263140 RepID=UPI00244396D0|nr:uncharacterized protein LOC129573366 [Sitodiplosis mosellana]